MAQRRENHPGQRHRRGRETAMSRTKKQYVRVEGEHRVRWIHDEDDWQHVYRTGRRLVCPDSDCTQRLKANQNRHGTRYLSNLGDTSACSHFVPEGGGGLMTDEHLWLQGMLRAMCRRLGYDAELEVGVAGARVDLRVEGKDDVFAFEVQRVSTDFTSRRAAREQSGMRTLWFLPESDRQKNTAAEKRRDPLFSEPCVRLGYRDGPGPGSNVMTVEDLRQSVWTYPAKARVHLRAGVTIGRLAPDRLSFGSGWLPLEKFVSQVLEGSRRWYPQGVIRGKKGGTWAGWLLTEDVQQYRNAVAAAKEERRRREEAAREAESARICRERENAAEATTKETVEPEAVSAGVGAGEASDEHEGTQQSKPFPVAHGDPTVRTASASASSSADPVRSDNQKSWWKRLWRFIVR